MGSKVNPNGLRYGINKDYQSRWVAKDNNQMANWLVQDDKIRNYVIKAYKNAAINNVEIERTQNSIDLIIHAAQPGLVIGTEGSELKVLTKKINIIVGRNIKVNIQVLNIVNPELCARIVAREIADAIENRVSFRTAQKFAMKKVLKAGAKGVKTHVSGRLGGVEMAREEGYSEGVVTLSTLRTDIDYALETAKTTYGIIGVKVWINRGEIFKNDFEKSKLEKSERPSRRNNDRNSRHGDNKKNERNFSRRNNSNNRNNNNNRSNSQNKPTTPNNKPETNKGE